MSKSGIDTIAAVSTPAGRAAISIIRLSGPDSFSITEKIFKKGGKKTFPLPYTAYYGSIIDPEDDSLIDKVVITTFPGPASYTGEDVAEISCHGNPVLVSRLLSLILNVGARQAEAGEFTRRAFINGKMDLLEVEAISQLLAAESVSQTKLALNQLQGLPSKQLSSLRDKLVNNLVELEAGLNFPEDAIEAIDEHKLAADLRAVRRQLEEFGENARNGSMICGGLKIALLGCPNSGKSSIMNCLLGKDRAIVTEIAGTTRDTLEESFQLGSVPVKLIDTAGLRSPGDKIEAMGIERTRRAAEEAFALIGVFDGSKPETVEDRKVMQQLKADSKPFICVRNKIDLPQKIEPEFFAGVTGVGVSTLNEAGLQSLKEEINLILERQGFADFESMVLLGAQQQNSLSKALAALKRACEGVGNIYQDMLAIEIEEAVRELGRITGETVDFSTLDLIFERFCIGK
ncbi:MAG: tRNA uridine-5-carboxymethylaminomethyl(34) synthesis GTPase MnmE [Candidatus Rifleibacteriota bacterium]